MTKTFPAHHTHAHTPHSCPPHTRLGTYLRQLPSRPPPCPAGDGHVPGPSASQPMELTQRCLSGAFEQRPSTQAPLPRPEDPFLHSDSALSPSHAQASLPSTPGPRPVRPQGPSAQGSPGRETRPETALISLTPRAGPWNSRVSVLSRVWASCITTVK